MNVVLFALQVVSLALAASADPYMKCTTQVCGTASGWFEQPRQSWTLQPGPYSTEVVPDSCLIGGIKGFKATVCLDSAYPTLHCDNEDRIFVGKNGASYGRIDVIPYCGILGHSDLNILNLKK